MDICAEFDFFVGDNTSESINIADTNDNFGKISFSIGSLVEHICSKDHKSGSSVILEGIFLAEDWTSECPYRQTVKIKGISYSNGVEIIAKDNISKEQALAYKHAMICSGSQGIDSITVKAYGDKPIVDLPFQAIIKR
ncbi:hypothetical protein [Anaeromicropila populeti]|uniref:Uncharacterized protein n=1 Tax=Anaeromicropila populeti TaxID=37658 RepID=A0A1I6JMX8_9FIRM|nr:hypothetical protein [Anaeromicropila populeti]SFR79920.1 hypothetical protein SAMN05661086_01735 [Anaeromicropila populeti]